MVKRATGCTVTDVGARLISRLAPHEHTPQRNRVKHTLAQKEILASHSGRGERTRPVREAFWTVR